MDQFPDPEQMLISDLSELAIKSRGPHWSPPDYNNRVWTLSANQGKNKFPCGKTLASIESFIIAMLGIIEVLRDHLQSKGMIQDATIKSAF